ncbi:uncharacterized protein TAF1C-like isoform X2 [Anabrus simplex]|uniref:uncharacterized protein TAF1C-like isoform X2 n=1 Tax=Anabrus simplex TaxID=316456 RepID=UPI0035A26DC0
MADIFLRGLGTLHRTLNHELFPGFELDLDGDIKPEEDFHGDAEHEFFLPASSVPMLQGQDPVNSLVTQKQEWIESYKLLIRSAKKQFPAERQTILRKKLRMRNSRVLVVPQHEIKFLELSRKDPDPEFSTGRLDYNWYYTGGTLKSLQIGGEELLLSTQGKAGDELRLTCLERDSSWKPVLPSADTTTPEKKKAILQVEGCSTQSTGFVGVRLRNKCIFYSIIQDHGCAPSLENCGESKSSKPFVGLDLCSEPKARYCTINTDQTVQVWDLATMRCSLTCEGKSKARRHRNQIQFSPGSEELILSNSHFIHLLDLRSGNRQKLPFKKQLDLLSCEEVSLVFPSRRSRHLLYVATTHKLALLDKRSSPCEVVSAWSHQMSSPPVCSHTLLLPSSQEVVCVANQRPATVQIAVPSTHQLLKLTTIQDSLNQAQSRGECLDPFLNTRLGQSLLGITCLPSVHEETGFSLLSLTAAGDVFYQRVQAGSNTRRGQGLRGTLPVPAKKLYVTKRCNMKKLYSGLKNKKLKLRREGTPEPTVPEAWQRSKSSLLKSTDVMSSILLEMWDLDECPDWSEEVPEMCEEDAIEEYEAVRKVSSWLENMSHPSQVDESSSEHSD